MREVKDSISIPPAEVKAISMLLAKTYSVDTSRHDTVYDVYTCHLGDGYFVDIVVRVDTSDCAHVDAFLFKDSIVVDEVPLRLKLLGDYEFKHEDTRYTITVKEGVQ